MIKYIQTSPVSSDCTASYDVLLDKEYTVKEFLEAILTQNANEWGYIYLMLHSIRPYHFTNPSCKYCNGEKTGKNWENIIMCYGDRKIQRACSSGGWSRMDYYIWMEEQ